jgi:hypothetical protein
MQIRGEVEFGMALLPITSKGSSFCSSILCFHCIAAAKCLQNFKGGVIMISHDMRLISQCAEQIYICDQKQIRLYKGDILDFKMKTRKENTKRLEQHING